MSDAQQSLFGDPTEERELFGDMAVTQRPALDVEGDYVLGRVESYDPRVDLKTDFGPVPIVTFVGIRGALNGRKVPVLPGQLYAWAAMHATARNQLEDLTDEPQKGERIGIRRGREFKSTQGPSEGKTLVSWHIVFPDRKGDFTKATKAAKATKPAKAASGEEPF